MRPGFGSSASAVLSPFILFPTLALPLAWIYTGIIILKLNVAFLFAYLWLREERLGKGAAAVGAILFGIGLIGFMTRRNLIVLFLSTELMFQGIAVNFIAFGRYHMGQAFFHGQAFVVFLLVIAATEASLALGLVVLLFRRKNTLDADAWRELKG